MGDSGSIVLGWLTKLVVLFAVLGLIGIDGAQLVVANFGAADDASTAASAASDNYRQTKNAQAAYDAAVAAVAAKGDTIETTTFTITSDGGVTLTVDRRPTTLWMHHFGVFKHLIDVHQTATSSPAP